jgi:Skp family chaperone for outer membrane proteins
MVGIQLYARLRRYAQDLQFNLMSIVTVFLLLMGCSSAYYGTMEKLGYHKRDLMVSRVESARDAQQEAKEEFKSALEKFSSVLQVDGGELEDKYDQLKTAYDKSDARAETVRDRIQAVEDVSEALFEEWQSELDQYTSDSLRRSSARKLKQTRRQYAQLINAMKRAEKKMEPVLLAFHDQVLFLKHNLNARAIASLQTELVSVEAEVNALIRDMEASIKEADAFIDSMAKE